jgi:diguanylate cyclase (GGDEF)-like protein
MYLNQTSTDSASSSAPAPAAARAVSLRSRLTAWALALAVLAVTAVALAGWLMYRASLSDQRQALAEQLRAGFQAQRSQLDHRAQWLAATLEQAGPAASADQWSVRLKNIAGTLSRDNLRAPTRLALIDRQGQALATWQPEGAGASPVCDSVRALASRWRDNKRGALAVGICAPGNETRYVVLAPVGTGPNMKFLEVTSNLLPSIQRLEQHLQSPLSFEHSDGRTIYRAAGWPVSVTSHLRAELPIVADTGNKAMLVLVAVRPVGAMMGGLSEVGTLAILLVLFAVATVGGGLYWYLERNLLGPLALLGARLRGVREPAVPCHAAAPRFSELAGVCEDVQRLDHQLEAAQQQYQQAALIDHLTQLPNRAAFLLAIERAIQRTDREDVSSLALLIVDLDGFRDINDTLGLAVGDALLCQVAQRLAGKLRSSDVIARVGSDEFALLLPHTDTRQATTAARLLLQAMRQSFTVDDQQVNLGASIGIALFPDHGVDPYALVQHADIALRAAKIGISGYTLYDTTLDGDNADRMLLLNDLRQAIGQEQFELHYQPKVDLVTGRASGVEALVRWRHPREGLLMPGRFIPLLEQTGLIRSLTPWLVNEAMRFARCLQEAGYPLTVSINLSARNLQDPQLADTLAEPLAAHHIDPSRIELEITESAVMDEPERACLMLNRLSGMGFRLAIDDFGTGYSSFSYLKRMPVNTIKIDKSFVLGMLNDASDTAIVRTSVGLAHSLGLQFVAEGVETAEMLDSLRGLACDCAQGNYLSRPLSGDALIEWLRHSSWGLGHGSKRASAA